MDTFKYDLDQKYYEIFPKDIYNDPLMVFHGTSSYHSKEIEQNGLVKGKSPYEVTNVFELIRVLEKPEFGDNTFLVNSIKEYVNAIRGKYFRLSFAYLSYFATYFAQGIAKGGQSLARIRRAEQIINNVLSSSPSLSNNKNDSLKISILFI